MADKASERSSNVPRPLWEMRELFLEPQYTAAVDTSGEDYVDDGADDLVTR